MSERDKRLNACFTAVVDGFHLPSILRAVMVLLVCLLFAGPAEAGGAEIRKGAFEAVFTERCPESNLQEVLGTPYLIRARIVNTVSTYSFPSIR